MNEGRVKLEPSWKERIGAYLERPQMQALSAFLRSEKQHGKVIFPPGPEIFAAFEHTPFEQVRVVILGQDPYHGPGQAHGLCFSVRKGVTVPPSLVNMYKEMKADLDIDPPGHGFLEEWAQQGLLMLNASLTVEAGKPRSHSKIGWEQFTDAVIRKVSEEKEGVVFLLWGKFAQQKEALIDTGKHFVLKAAHPSPFSATAGFFGSRPFSKTNKLLEQQGKQPIDWRLTP